MSMAGSIHRTDPVIPWPGHDATWWFGLSCPKPPHPNYRMREFSKRARLIVRQNSELFTRWCREDRAEDLDQLIDLCHKPACRNNQHTRDQCRSRFWDIREMSVVLLLAEVFAA